MKTSSTFLFFTLFLIAFRAESMPASFTFPSLTPLIEATSSSGTSKAKKPKKTKAKKGNGVTFHDGSAESRGDRDKRLMRECKGRPNSGACEGYARP
jgi:hypothetical protein